MLNGPSLEDLAHDTGATDAPEGSRSFESDKTADTNDFDHRSRPAGGLPRSGGSVALRDEVWGGVMGGPCS